MRVPLSWLKELTPLGTDPADRAAVRDLGRVLDSLGLVVEGVEHVGEGLGGVVLARVLEIREIDGADRIRHVLVDRGGPGPLGIVCGAANFTVGDVVPLATVGAVLPGGMSIARRTMRGVVSDGMLCSGRELGLSGDGAGLLVLFSQGLDAELPPTMVLGAPLADYLGVVPDVVYDLAVEPNRPDCLSVLGVARDLAARLGLTCTVANRPATTAGPAARELASLSVVEPDACRHLVARVFTDVVVTASPPAVARRLMLAGMRPINSVVDASNYVMLELGQPTHPYDLDALGGRGLTVRFARPGERLVTLDGVERILGTHRDARGEEHVVDDLVICDAKDVAVGLAGIMGGASSEIGTSTTRVLLEVAEFAPLAVARTAKRHGLRSEASVRFERGVDSGALGRAADRFAALLADAAADAGLDAPVVAPGDLDAHLRPVERVRLRLRVNRANALLGTQLSLTEMTSLLAPIGFVVSGGDPDRPVGGAGEAAPEERVVEVDVPTFRPDVTREVDLIEEVARHFGYEHITPTRRRSPDVGSLGETNVLRRRLRRLLTGIGAHEAWTASMVDPATQRRAGYGQPLVAVANPMVLEESVLRGNLLAGLLEALRYNASHREASLRLFEIGHVFPAGPQPDDAPDERELLGVLFAAEGDDASAPLRAWHRLVEGLAIAPGTVLLDQRIGAPARKAAAGDRATDDGATDDGATGSRTTGAWLAGLHPARRARLVVRPTDVTLGALGEIDPEALAAFDLPTERRVGWLTIDLEVLASLPQRDGHARPVSRFPSSDIDLAFVLSDDVPVTILQQSLEDAAGELCVEVRLLDVYRGPGVTRDARSVTFRMRFCALDRTLTDAEVSQLREACIAAASSQHDAVLRS